MCHATPEGSLVQPDQPLAGCRILIVEDEHFIGLEMDNLLTEAGAEIIGPVCDVESAMREARRNGFGLAVLDVRVHGGLTYDIADELSRHDVPFIFTTGYEKRDIPERFANVRCWMKPVDEKQLVDGLVAIFLKAKAPPPSQASAAL